MNEIEKRGIAAIIYLQGLAGITETEEAARAGWRKMTPNDRAQTLTAYGLFTTATRSGL